MVDPVLASVHAVLLFGTEGVLDIMPSVPQPGETCLLKTINSPKIKDKCRAGCDVFSCEPRENTVGHTVEWYVALGKNPSIALSKHPATSLKFIKECPPQVLA